MAKEFPNWVFYLFCTFCVLVAFISMMIIVDYAKDVSAKETPTATTVWTYKMNTESCLSQCSNCEKNDLQCVGCMICYDREWITTTTAQPTFSNKKNPTLINTQSNSLCDGYGYDV